MKRNLFENVKVQPYASGEVVDKRGFLSAILGCKIGTAGDLTLTVTHSDDGTNFEAVTDERVFPEAKTIDGTYTVKSLAKDDVVNIDIDLLGLRDYVKITASGAAAANTALALALGDAREMPV